MLLVGWLLRALGLLLVVGSFLVGKDTRQLNSFMSLGTPGTNDTYRGQMTIKRIIHSIPYLHSEDKIVKFKNIAICKYVVQQEGQPYIQKKEGRVTSSTSTQEVSEISSCHYDTIQSYR
jgi:hypothetical protein